MSRGRVAPGRASRAWFVHLLIAVAALGTPGPTPLEAQILMGRVTDASNGEGVAESTVTLQDANGADLGRAAADRRGDFFLRAGQRLASDARLVVEALGYRTHTLLLGDLPSFSTAGMHVAVGLTPEPLAVEGVMATVSAEPLIPRLVQAGFYERQRTHFGRYLVLDDLDRAHAQRASDLFRGIPGVRIQERGRLQGGEPAMGYGSCYPSVFVDGGLSRRGGGLSPRIEATPFDHLVSSNNVQAIEVFRSP